MCVLCVCVCVCVCAVCVLCVCVLLSSPGAVVGAPSFASRTHAYTRTPRTPRPPPRGAAQGEGLGNAFLSNIAAVDGIFHVCRAFEDTDITHVEDRIDPVEDLEIIHACVRRVLGGGRVCARVCV